MAEAARGRRIALVVGLVMVATFLFYAHAALIGLAAIGANLVAVWSTRVLNASSAIVLSMLALVPVATIWLLPTSCTTDQVSQRGQVISKSSTCSTGPYTTKFAGVPLLDLAATVPLVYAGFALSSWRRRSDAA